MVSVVIPMLDEAGFIDDCLDAFAAQTYPHDRFELLVVDGGSTDGSRELVTARGADEPWIRLVDNPDRKASSAFNRGIESATGDVLCLFSAHGVPTPTYIEASVRALTPDVAGVGGLYHHKGLDRVSTAIGLAMTSPFGMASTHRRATERRPVDTISHPAYRIDALRAVGPFDETLLRNSDYDMNVRLRAEGHTLMFDPGVESTYRPRGSLRALRRQFWWYGRWKARVAVKQPAGLRPRHLVAPAFAIGTAISPALLLTARGRRTVMTLASAYVGVIVLAVERARPWANEASTGTFAASLPTMHLAWGGGFVTSLLEDAVTARRRPTRAGRT